MCTSRFVSPALEERKKKGLLTSGDLERMYGLTVRQTDRILSAATSSRPFDVGCVLSLEGALLDLTTILGYSFAALAGEIGKSAPQPKVVQECVGLTFHESLVPLGWGDLSSEMQRLSEARFEEIALKLMEGDLFNVPARTGSEALLQALINEKQTVKLTINTSLSRKVAIKALSKAGLSSVFEGRVDIGCLVHPDKAQFLDRMEGQQLLRCCAEMSHAPMTCVLVDSNSRRLLQAKRVGMCTVAIKEGAAYPVMLRHSDRLLDKLQACKPADLYTILRRNVELSCGMKQQPEAAAALIPTQTTKLVAPAMEDNRRRAEKRDTFADEYKSDVL